jgi:hypothetical protein
MHDASNDGEDLFDDNFENFTVEERIRLAIIALDTSESGLSERKAAAYYRVPRATLQNRRKGIPTRVQGHAHERNLTPAQESVLTECVKVRIERVFLSYILSDCFKVMGRRGIPLDLTVIGQYASEIAGRPVGATWARRFKERNPGLKVMCDSVFEFMPQ